MAWLSGYTYRKKITIDSSYIDENLTDVPVLVRLTDSGGSPNFDFSSIKGDFSDIRFTASDGGTLLDYEFDEAGLAGASGDGLDDSSSSAHTVTAVSGASVNTSDSEIGDGSAVCNGSTDYFSSVDSPDWDFGANDFCIETFIKFSSIKSNTICSRVTSGGSYFYFCFEGGSTLRFRDYPGGIDMSRSVSVSTGVWYHVAITRDGNDWRMFLDGVQQGATVSSAWSMLDRGAALTIGHLTVNGAYVLNGRLDEFRISVGDSRYTSNFTPTSTAFTDDAYTKLLLHFEIEPPETDSLLFWTKVPSVSSTEDTDFYIYYNNPSATDEQNPADLWDAYTAVWHMKEELDGTLDELIDSTENGHDGQGQGSVPNQYTGIIGYGEKGLGSNSYITAPDVNDLDITADFELSWKMKWIGSVTSGSIFGKSDGGGGSPKWIINYGNLVGAAMAFYGGGSTVSWAWSPVADTDYHCRLRRTGNDWSFYVNGTQQGSTVTSAITVPNTTRDFCFFTDGESWQWFVGVLDEVRLLNGSITSAARDKAEYYSDSNQLLSFGIEESLTTTEYQLTPALQWSSKAIPVIAPSLEWYTVRQTEKDLALQWQAKYSHRFCPNLINYEFDFLVPTVYTSKNTTTVSGVLHSITINMKDTGSSGSTIIGLYLDGTLKSTQTITADNSEYEEVVYFDMSTLVYPSDTIEIRVTQVATGAEDLKICVYEMTFPFELDKTFFGNIKDSVSFIGINRDYLFNNADSWTIDFNQPITDVTHLVITDVNEDTIAASYSISNGNFYRSRLTITPYTTTTINKITAKIQDQNKKNYSFNFYPIIENNFADYPSYVSEVSADVEVFLPATYYKYSFDAGVTWSDWGTIGTDNTMNIDFTDASEGTNTLTVTYRNGSEELTETVNIYYVSGVIDCNIIFYGDTAKITYSDGVPLDRIELYYDDALSDTFNVPVKDGLDSFTVDAVAKTLTVAEGSIYWNNERHYWDGSAYTVDPDFSGNDFNTYWKYTFGFNTVTKSFEFKEEVDLTPFSGVDEDIYDNFLKIWSQKIITFGLNADWSSWSLNLPASALSVFEPSTIPITMDLDKVIKVKVLDVAGRTRDFTFDFTQTRYNIWRDVSVTRNNVEESAYAGTDIGGYAFDGSSSFWTSPTAGSLPQWIRYECGYGSNKKTIVEYAITNRYEDLNALPTDWKFQGSIDGDTWVDLDVVSGETWSATETKEYAISNTTAYVYYRLYVTGTSGGLYVQIAELELRESIGGANVASYVTSTEVLPGQIHGSAELNIDIESEEWELDSMNGGY